MNGISRKQHGFTIVELLIVIVVIGILASITVVAFNGIQQRSTTARYTAAVDQWEKLIRMEGSLRGNEMLPGLRVSCLGSSINDFPETADFPEGVCMVSESNPADNWLYHDDAFDGWEVSRPKSDLPVTNLSLNGDTMRARGVLLLTASSDVTSTSRAQAAIHWIPQIAGECGRGSEVSETEAGSLSGGWCKIGIEFY